MHRIAKILFTLPSGTDPPGSCDPPMREQACQTAPPLTHCGFATFPRFYVFLHVNENEVRPETIFKRIGVSYVDRYNGKYERTGHLFRDRFKSEPAEDDAYLLTVTRISAGILSRPDCAKGRKTGLTAACRSTLRRTSFQPYGKGDDGRRAVHGAERAVGRRKCMDMEDQPRKQLTDSRAWELIRRKSGCEDAAEFQRPERDKRDAALDKA